MTDTGAETVRQVFQPIGLWRKIDVPLRFQFTGNAARSAVSIYQTQIERFFPIIPGSCSASARI